MAGAGGMADYYRVGVELSLHDAITAGMNAVVGQFAMLQKQGQATEQMLGRIKVAIVGIGSALAATELMSWVRGLADASGKLQTIESQMRMAGWREKIVGPEHRGIEALPESLRPKNLASGDGHTVGDIEHARKEAFRLSGIYKAIAPHEILQSIKEAAFVFGDRGHAIEYAEKLAQFKTSMMAAQHDPTNARALEGQIMAGIRALELKGAANDPKEFGALLEGMAQAITASGGTVTPQDYLMAMKYARTSGYTMDSNFFRYVLPSLSQEMGGSTVGTSLMTLQQMAMGLSYNRAQIHQLREMNLLEDDTRFERAGFKMRVIEGGLKGRDILRANPWDWVHGTLVPELEKKGFDITKREDLMKVAVEIGRLFPDRTAADIVTKLLTQASKLRKDALMGAESMGLDAASREAMDQHYTMSKYMVGKQWERLQEMAGLSSTGPMIKWMNANSDVMAKLGDTFVKYPGLGTTLSVTLVGLAAGLGALAAALVGGLLLTSGIGVIALVIGGITSLAVAIGALAVIHWDKIKAGIDWIVSGFQKLWNMLPSVPGRVAPSSPDAPLSDGMVMPQSWVLPPPKQGEQLIETRVQLNLDGMRLADAVAHHIVRRGAHPHSGGQFDGSMSPTAVDFLNL